MESRKEGDVMIEGIICFLVAVALIIINKKMDKYGKKLDKYEKMSVCNQCGCLFDRKNYGVDIAKPYFLERKLLICSACEEIRLLKQKNMVVNITQKLEYKTCETCGCLIDPEHAVKGKPIIMYRAMIKTGDSKENYKVLEEPHEFIYTPYYCKKCAKPKKKDKK